VNAGLTKDDLKRGASSDVVGLLLGTSGRQVRHLSAQKVLPQPSKRGLYDILGCVQAYVRYVAEDRRPSAIAGARAKDLEASAGLKQLKLRKEAGQLLDLQETRVALAEFGVALVSVLEGLPGRLTGRIHGIATGTDRSRIHALLKEEIRQVRTAMADGLEAIVKEKRDARNATASR
jgi:hypothetical protein